MIKLFRRQSDTFGILRQIIISGRNLSKTSMIARLLKYNIYVEYGEDDFATRFSLIQHNAEENGGIKFIFIVYKNQSKSFVL
jgi:hypothetical protein